MIAAQCVMPGRSIVQSVPFASPWSIAAYLGCIRRGSVIVSILLRSSYRVVGGYITCR